MNDSQRQAHYFVPQPTVYPVILAGALGTLALGFIFLMNKVSGGPWIMLAGAGVILYVVVHWFGKVIDESQSGQYKKWEDLSFRWGMVWFIVSEVMFFAAFFGALFYVRNISAPALSEMSLLWPGYTGEWPTSGPKGPGFTPMAPWGIPALNTLLLLSSGATVTWAHWALIKDRREQLVAGLGLTVALGLVFLGFQVYEYYHAYTDLGLTLKAGVYGATFFMLTGFHGFHVTLGAVMLIVILGRVLKGHFTPTHHFAFEAAAWYWHFVDVVWLGLFIFVYWL